MLPNLAISQEKYYICRTMFFNRIISQFLSHSGRLLASLLLRPAR
jgi:hypothetical protein